MVRLYGRNVSLLCLMMGVVVVSDVGSSARAQATDPAQLEQLGRIQDSQDQRRVALEAAQQQAAQQAARQAQLAQERQRKQAAASAARAAAARNAQESRDTTDWEDERRYREASRALALKEQQLKIQMMETRANRESDFINADLAQKQAETDHLVQSSQGDEKLKSDIGEATKMSQRHWWEGH